MVVSVSFVVIVVLASFALALVLGAVAARAVSSNRRLAVAKEQLEATRQMLEAELAQKGWKLQEEQGRTAALTTQIEQAEAASKQKEEWLEYAEKDVRCLRAELEKRPKVTRKTYKILTLGIKATGKTSLTLKWANPLVDIGAIQGTKIERYERTVSQVALKDITTEHVFEVGDWGGEHIVDALQELIIDEVHGLLIVVDLGDKGATSVQPERVREQLGEFQPQSLRYFFAPKTVASCKTVVLFINKADLIPGTPAEAEARAHELYAKLIDDLSAYKAHVDIRILVGSASYGHSTHHLFAHFVEKILPKNAYDHQLLQRMKSDLPAAGEAVKPTAAKGA